MNPEGGASIVIIVIVYLINHFMVISVNRKVNLLDMQSESLTLNFLLIMIYNLLTYWTINDLVLFY